MKAFCSRKPRSTAITQTTRRMLGVQTTTSHTVNWQPWPFPKNAIWFTIQSASVFACSMVLTYRRAENSGKPWHHWWPWTWTDAPTCWWGVLEQECQWWILLHRQSGGIVVQWPMECWLVLLSMKMCQHNTVSQLCCVVAFGLAHHLGCTGLSQNDVKIPVLYFWPPWLGRFRKIPGQWLYLMYARERGSRYCPCRQHGLFCCWGTVKSKYQACQAQAAQKTRGAVFLIHGISVGAAFKSTAI